jgi:hypothetical protein
MLPVMVSGAFGLLPDLSPLKTTVVMAGELRLSRHSFPRNEFEVLMLATGAAIILRYKYAVHCDPRLGAV